VSPLRLLAVLPLVLPCIAEARPHRIQAIMVDWLGVAYFVVVAAIAVVVLAAWLWTRLLRIAPDFRLNLMGVPVDLFVRSWTKLRWIKADAMIVPVSSNAWVGKFIEKAVRDAGGDVIQEGLKQGGPLEAGAVRVVPAGKLKPKYLIAANIYDATNRTDSDAVATAFDNAIAEAVERGCKTVMFADFSAEYEYSRDRQPSSFAARCVVDAITRNRSKLGCARVFILNSKYLGNYIRALKETHHYTPAEAAAGA
jgi:O-acetyl-ADP-ribose deacetylase (regulator of RNase III)